MKPVRLLAPVFAVLLVGCATSHRPSPAATAPTAAAPARAEVAIPTLKSLNGTSWVLVELEGEPIAPPTEGWAAQSLAFDAAGTALNGYGGINRFGGRYQQDGALLRFGPLAMTRRAGPEAQMDSERRYTAILSRVVAWRQEGTRLVLVGREGASLARLEPAKE